jgi:diaminopimelate decarboxylase
VTLLLKELSPQGSRVNIISEPGRYFVKAAYALCSQIYRVLVEKDENDVQVHRHYYIVHGVQEVFEDVMLCEEESIPIPLPNGYSTTRN